MDANPVRKISNIRSKKNTGFFPSKKIGRPVAFESLLERDYIFLIEFDNDVTYYQEQPLSIQYFYSGKKYKYTPDFKIIRKSASQLIEIKPKDKLEKILCDEKAKRKFYAGHQFCVANEYEFKIVTDEEIRSGFLLNNIKYLFMYSQIHVPAKDKINIRNLLNTSSPLKIMQLYELIPSIDIDKYKPYIFSMLYSQQLKTDLNRPLNEDSLVFI